MRNLRSITAKLSVIALIGLMVSGCTTEGALISLGATTAYGARSPGNELEQIYYLGIFDPREQLSPEVYRVRVHGQASLFSGTRFASGWAPASFVDSLGSNFAFANEDDRLGELTFTNNSELKVSGVGRSCLGYA